MIYIINGISGSGKSTFASFVIQSMGPTAAIELSTVDDVKAAAKILGWTGTKTVADREFLYGLKNLAIAWTDAPVQQTAARANKFISTAAQLGISDKHVCVFINTRDPYEIMRFKDMFGEDCKSLLVYRAGLDVSKLTSADKSVLEFDYDITIANNGTLMDLGNAALDFITKEGLK